MTASPSFHRSDEDVSIQLQQLEEKHDLLRHTIDGWSAWPLLRFSVAGALQALPLDRGGVGFSKRELLPLALGDLRRFLLKRRRSRYVVKTLGSYHSEIVSGRKKDIFFDNLLKITGGFYKIEVVNRRSFHLNAKPNLVARDLSTVALDILANKLAARFPVTSLAKMSMQISECLKTDLGLEITPHFITACLSSFHWSRRLYRKVLKRVEPRVLLLADVGDYPITAAARELGIKVVEFQHGIVNRDYPASSWSRYALPYKESMAIPDRVLLFGAYWQREMTANGFWSGELRTVGSLRVDEYRGQLRDRNDDVCTIVVTTQGVDSVRMISYFEEFLRLANNRIRLRLIFKMHPVYQTTNDLFTSAFANNSTVVIVSAAQQPSTFELLQQSHLHVSIYSMCHYEALALNIPTIILPLAGAERMQHLKEAGGAFFPRTPGELLDLSLRWRELDVPTAVGDQYFAPDALKNIQDELTCLYDRGMAATA